MYCHSKVSQHELHSWLGEEAQGGSGDAGGVVLVQEMENSHFNRFLFTSTLLCTNDPFSN